MKMNNLLSKIFSTKGEGRKRADSDINIYLDADCKRSIETVNQTVESYLTRNQFENDQFLYLLIKNRKTGEVVLKRKLLGFEYFTETVAKHSNEEYKAYVMVGYSSERNTVPRINSMLALTEGLKFIRSGTLQKFSDSRQVFEQCQLKLHHDYLTYYKLRSKEKKVSFLPLENASVEIVHDKKNIFTVRDKFKTITFKSGSKEDMIGWLLSINEAIKVRNAQIYMSELDDKLGRKIKDKLNLYLNRCASLRDSNRTMLLDEIGRKALKDYFRKHPDNIDDSKMLSLIETYLYMCKVRRERGEADSDPIINSIKEVLQEMREILPPSVKDKNFESKQDLIKAIEEIMRVLDQKYRKLLLEKKILHCTFQSHIIEQYRENSRIPVKTLFGEQPRLEAS